MTQGNSRDTEIQSLQSEIRWCRQEIDNLRKSLGVGLESVESALNCKIIDLLYRIKKLEGSD